MKSIFLGENYATRPMASENDKNRKEIFSLHIFPKTFRDLPDGGELKIKKYLKNNHPRAFRTVSAGDEGGLLPGAWSRV